MQNDFSYFTATLSEELYNEFIKYCKDNNIHRTKMVSIILSNFLEKYGEKKST